MNTKQQLCAIATRICVLSDLSLNKALSGIRVQAGVFTTGGRHEVNILHAGDAGYAPKSSAHWFKNVGSTDSYVVLIFNAGILTNLEATTLVAHMPAEVSHCCSSGPSLIAPARKPFHNSRAFVFVSD